MDASATLTELDEKLRDATSRFERMPGALWLAATAIVESASRLGDLAPDLAERRSELLLRARRARDDAGPRSSENDVSAITLWVELAEKRATLERVVQASLKELAAHRAAHPRLGAAPTTRQQLERALGEREKEVEERKTRLAESLRQSDAESKGSPDDDTLADAVVLARARDARARLDHPRDRWLAPLVALAAVAMALTFATQVWIRGAIVLVGLALAGVAYGARAAGVRRDLALASAMRRRDLARSEAAARDLVLLTQAARALGAVDAFGATEDGRTLEDRESKLVTLAPWIRELVSGFDADEAARFA